MPVFAVRTMRGPGWDGARDIREQAQWPEHARFADALVEDGRILFGGPVEDPDPDVVALVAVEAPDASGARQLFADDPWIRAGVLGIKDVCAWSIWLRSTL